MILFSSNSLFRIVVVAFTYLERSWSKLEASRSSFDESARTRRIMDRVSRLTNSYYGLITTLPVCQDIVDPSNVYNSKTVSPYRAMSLYQLLVRCAIYLYIAVYLSLSSDSPYSHVYIVDTMLRNLNIDVDLIHNIDRLIL